MTYVIYGAPGSGSGVVEAACAELGVTYEPPVRVGEAHSSAESHPLGGGKLHTRSPYGW